MKLFEKECADLARRFYSDMTVLEKHRGQIDELEALAEELNGAGIAVLPHVCPHSHNATISLWIGCYSKDDQRLLRMLEIVTANALKKGAVVSANEAGDRVEHGIKVEEEGKTPFYINLQGYENPQRLMDLLVEAA